MCSSDLNTFCDIFAAGGVQMTPMDLSGATGFGLQKAIPGPKKPPRRGVATGGWSAVGQRLVNGWSTVGQRLVNGRSTVGQRSVNGRSTVGQRLGGGYIPDCPQTTVGPKMHFWEKNSLAPEKSIGAIWTPPTAELSQKMLLRQPAQGNDRAQAVRKPCVNAPSMRLQCAFNAPSMRLQCVFNAPSK